MHIYNHEQEENPNNSANNKEKKTHKNIKIGVHVTLTHSGEAGINKKQHTEIANQSVIRK